LQSYAIGVFLKILVEEEESSMSLGRSARTFLQALIIPAWWTIALFGSAGQLTWKRGWICTVLYLGAMYVSKAVLKRVSPSLWQNREEAIRKDTKPFDKIFMRSYLFLIVVLPVIAGLDVVRLRWSALPFWTTYPGIALFAVSFVLIIWTLAMNPHAESSVRIQNDRGHSVISSGPYRFVRHPMYVGLILLHVSMSLILGSVGTLNVAAVIAVLLFWRTAFEDRTLRRELPGYEDYTSITRYRLMPGIW
jgi:protein-S-isoprenylcysteine O-methyltransferase Ste14